MCNWTGMKSVTSPTPSALRKRVRRTLVAGRYICFCAPWYVAAKDAARNALIVVQGHDHPLLESRALTTGAWHWLAPARREPFRAAVKVRYRQSDQAARLEPRADGTVHIVFEELQRAVTPGQYAVAYEGERCLGGGVIESLVPSERLSAAA